MINAFVLIDLEFLVLIAFDGMNAMQLPYQYQWENFRCKSINLHVNVRMRPAIVVADLAGRRCCQRS